MTIYTRFGNPVEIIKAYDNHLNSVRIRYLDEFEKDSLDNMERDTFVYNLKADNGLIEIQQAVNDLN